MGVSVQILLKKGADVSQVRGRYRMEKEKEWIGW